MDTSLLIYLNRWLAADPARFNNAVWLADRPPLMFIATLIVALWFYGSLYLPERIMREESRHRAILMFASVLFSLMIVQLLQIGAARLRPIASDVPLQIPVEPSAWKEIISLLQMDKSFPSTQAAALFAVAIALFFWHPIAGAAGIIGAALLSLFRVGIGYNYPTDILAGALIGGAISFVIQMKHKWFESLTQWLTMRFEPDQQPWLFYPLAFVGLLDFIQRFDTALSFVFLFFGFKR